MKIIHCNKNTVDVFLGSGWDSWGRFKISHKDRIAKCYQVAGNKFNNKEVSQLESKVNE